MSIILKLVAFWTTLFLIIQLTGCTVTGSLAYTDPKTGAVAQVGVSHTSDGKQIRRLGR